MAPTNGSPRHCAGGPGCTHSVKIRYNDCNRREQLRRFEQLELQLCLEEAEGVKKQIDEQVSRLPEGVRLDAPSLRLIAIILGFLRTAASLKDNPMRVLELSAEESAGFVKCSKSQFEAAMRWLDSKPITYGGKVVAMGLGIVERVQRIGQVLKCGHLQGVYRSSTTTLTETGQRLLGLLCAIPAKIKGAFDKPAASRQRRKSRKAARKNALATIGDSIKNFFGLSPTGEPEETLDTVDESTLTPIAREFLERGKRLAEQRRAIG